MVQLQHKPIFAFFYRYFFLSKKSIYKLFVTLLNPRPKEKFVPFVCGFFPAAASHLATASDRRVFFAPLLAHMTERKRERPRSFSQREAVKINSRQLCVTHVQRVFICKNNVYLSLILLKLAVQLFKSSCSEHDGVVIGFLGSGVVKALWPVLTHGGHYPALHLC